MLEPVVELFLYVSLAVDVYFHDLFVIEISLLRIGIVIPDDGSTWFIGKTVKGASKNALFRVCGVA